MPTESSLDATPRAWVEVNLSALPRTSLAESWTDLHLARNYKGGR